MTPTAGPTRPDDVVDVPLRTLAGIYASEMLGHRCFGGKGYALAALADGMAITERVDADRWTTVVAALTEGVDIADVAEAMSLDPDGVRIGLTMWAVAQRREGSLSETRYEEILSLQRATCYDTASEPDSL